MNLEQLKDNFQKLQVVKKSEKGQQKQPATTVKQPPTTVFFLWSNSL
jgi:hypothetical protein